MDGFCIHYISEIRAIFKVRIQDQGYPQTFNLTVTRAPQPSPALPLRTCAGILPPIFSHQSVSAFLFPYLRVLCFDITTYGYHKTWL